MVIFNSASQRYQLTLDAAIFERLGLIDPNGKPLLIRHPDEELLRDLEMELLGRYRVREADFLRHRRRSRWRDGISLAAIIVLLASQPLQQQLADRWHLHIETVILVLTGTLLTGYLLVLVIFGPGPSPEQRAEALRQDAAMRTWIRQHAQ